MQWGFLCSNLGGRLAQFIPWLSISYSLHLLSFVCKHRWRRETLTLVFIFIFSSLSSLIRWKYFPAFNLITSQTLSTASWSLFPVYPPKLFMMRSPVMNCIAWLILWLLSLIDLSTTVFVCHRQTLSPSHHIPCFHHTLPPPFFSSKPQFMKLLMTITIWNQIDNGHLLPSLWLEWHLLHFVIRPWYSWEFGLGPPMWILET